jgi:drug/metabolite transporter (DMT)-like permease
MSANEDADNAMIAAARTPILWLWSQPYLLLVLTTLMWAGNAIASRLAVGHVSPMALTSLRWIAVCLIMPVIFRRELVQHAPVLKRKWKLIVLMGCVGFTAFNTMMYIAAHHTTAINIGIVQGSIPVIVLIGALLVYGTPIRALQIAGVAITILGVVMVATKGDANVLASLAFNIGDLWMIVACFFYAGYTIALRERPQIPGLVFFTAVAIIACLVSLPLLAWEIAAGIAFWPTTQGWFIVLYVALFPSLLSQIFFMRGVDTIGPGRAGVFVNLVPVFAALLAVLILTEPFEWYHAVALALVLGGIWLAEQRRSA